MTASDVPLKASMRGPGGLAWTGVGAAALGAWLIASGRLAAGGAATLVSGVALAGACVAAEGRGPWGRFLTRSWVRMADVAILGALAWHLRLDQRRAAGVVIAALGVNFMVSYARTRAQSVGYRIRFPAGEALVRAAVTALGLLIPHAVEGAAWVLVAAGIASAVAVGRRVWRATGGALSPGAPE